MRLVENVRQSGNFGSKSVQNLSSCGHKLTSSFKQQEIQWHRSTSYSMRAQCRHRARVELGCLPVLIFDESGKPLCTGKLDLVATINGETALGDIKRISRLYPGLVQ